MCKFFGLCYRKDSFITHRAFCDALADESARFSTPPAPSANLNFRNHELMNVGLNNLQNGGSSQFNFRPAEMGGLESGNQLNLDLQKPRLPMWLDNANPHSNYLGSNSSSLPAELVQMGGSSSQNQWFSRGQDESFGGGDIINVNASSSAMPRGALKEEDENNKGDLSEAISSMYYSNNNNNPNQNQQTSSSLVPMSATALLQKAAQMGSTRSSNTASSIFNTGFGLMSSTFSNLGTFNNNSMNQRRNEGHENNNNNLSGLMASTSASTLTSSRGDHGLLLGDINSGGTGIGSSSRNSDPAAIGLMANNRAEAENSLTRDFLGVGGNENRHFLQEKFAMGMSHYSRNH